MPESFELTAEQLAAAQQLAGIEQAEFGQAPPADVLAPAGVLGDDGALHPDVDAALRAVRDPAVLTQVVANRAGEPVWTQAWVSSTGKAPLVLQTQTESTNVYRLLDEPGAAGPALADTTGVGTSGGDGGGLPTLTLDLGGFAALVALVDAAQTESLRSRLDRRPADPRTPCTVDALSEQLDRGTAAIDSTWLVTAARPITPVDLGAAHDRLGDGLASLAGAGVVADTGDGRVVSPEGERVLASLAATTATIGAYYPLAGPDGQPTLDHVALLGGPATTWVARWSDVTATTATVELRPGSADDGVRALSDLVGRGHEVAAAAIRASEESVREEERRAAEAAEAERRAEEERHAAAARVEDERRAADAEAERRAEEERRAAEAAATPALVESSPAPAATSSPSWDPEPTPAPDAGVAPTWAPEPVPDPAPADTAWTPTHRVPAVGMWAWTEPDPAAQPAAALDPHLEVQAGEHRGEWVRIVCSNGWEAWVDGRQLVAR